MTFCFRPGPEHEVHRRSRIRQGSENRQNQKDTILADIALPIHMKAFQDVTR